jgi:uncharacterized membrane protein YfcA
MLMTLLDLFVVIYALNGLRPGRTLSPISTRWAVVYGAVGGVFSAMFGSGGWVYSMYLLRRLDEPQEIRATQTAVLMFSSFIRVGLFVLAGRLLDRQLLLLVVLMLPGLALGLFIGHRISQKLNRKRFMQVLYTVLLLSGTSLLLRSLL